MSVGDNIKKFRLLNKMEQKDLARKLHISDKTISSWECGRTEPKMGMIEEMAKIFNISKTQLIDDIPTFIIENRHGHILTEEENNIIQKLREMPQHERDFYARMILYYDRLKDIGVEPLVKISSKPHKYGVFGFSCCILCCIFDNVLSRFDKPLSKCITRNATRK